MPFAEGVQAGVSIQRQDLQEKLFELNKKHQEAEQRRSGVNERIALENLRINRMEADARIDTMRRRDEISADRIEAQQALEQQNAMLLEDLQKATRIRNLINRYDDFVSMDIDNPRRSREKLKLLRDMKTTFGNQFEFIETETGTPLPGMMDPKTNQFQPFTVPDIAITLRQAEDAIISSSSRLRARGIDIDNLIGEPETTNQVQLFQRGDQIAVVDKATGALQSVFSPFSDEEQQQPFDVKVITTTKSFKNDVTSRSSQDISFIFTDRETGLPVGPPVKASEFTDEMRQKLLEKANPQKSMLEKALPFLKEKANPQKSMLEKALPFLKEKANPQKSMLEKALPFLKEKNSSQPENGTIKDEIERRKPKTIEEFIGAQ